MARVSAALALIVAVAAGMLLVSGGSDSDPRTPAGLPGLPAPFLGIAVVGDGGLTAAVDAYGDVVDLRASPAGPPLQAVAAARQAAGTVAPAMAIVPRLRLGNGRWLPFWRADAVAQRYLPGTNVLETTARFGALWASVAYFARGDVLGCRAEVEDSARMRVSLGGASNAVRRHLRCDAAGDSAAMVAAARSDRRWLHTSAPLARSAPAWAKRMYGRSLLTLRALTDRRTGAVAAGARDGWAYVWPRDASAAAQALATAGHRSEAQRIVRFLLRLDLGAAARFDGSGSPIPGRGPQGDAAGWVAVAAGKANATGGRAAGNQSESNRTVGSARAVRADRAFAGGHSASWRDRPDYQEKAPGNYLGNAIAATATEPSAKRAAAARAIARAFGGRRGLDRVAGDPGSGLDSAAAWAVRPFALPRLYPSARGTLRQLLARSGRFGIVPSDDWPDPDPWSAPTAWSAWAFAALARAERRQGDSALASADRRDALALLADLRRAATSAGELPERVDAVSGNPRSTTPLAWSHAFAVLALRELWAN